ncbi:MAG: prephenate dehydrogenase [Burkholderiaceae bacterium]|nr:prephenate dehydrogenase [Burkholderiaceae bacterium]
MRRARIRACWAAPGPRVVELDPPVHDRVFAEVSHWPHAVVFAMCSAIANGRFADDALRFAGAGLRDSSRIGASSPQLWADILLDNREPVLDCARAFEAELAALLAALRAGDRTALAACFEPGSRWRQALKPGPGGGRGGWGAGGAAPGGGGRLA